jgi:hypothetical protein
MPMPTPMPIPMPMPVPMPMSMPMPMQLPMPMPTPTPMSMQTRMARYNHIFAFADVKALERRFLRAVRTMTEDVAPAHARLQPEWVASLLAFARSVFKKTALNSHVNSFLKKIVSDEPLNTTMPIWAPFVANLQPPHPAMLTSDVFLLLAIAL